VYAPDWTPVNNKRLTSHTAAVMKDRAMPTRESFTWKGAGGADVQGWIVKPPGFDPKKQYPMIVFIHGGPQGAWMDAWSTRWNPAIYASQGYVVFCPNPRGSTGFGHKFCEEISKDWGGKVYADLQKGFDAVVAQGYVDPNRMGAAGGSYGGYMVNWILGHDHRFKALVSHAGVYNLESMYGSTEELWFPEWEFAGPPWENRELYEKWSPHRFATAFKTPTLVIHGELDYRVPVTQGMELFTALQRRGVPSKFLYYPDEGHWVLKPRNARLWNATVLGWFDWHLKKP
jgi:dipeptidyl aminopeptidase/acylaminoacyl peptidase